MTQGYTKVDGKLYLKCRVDEVSTQQSSLVKIVRTGQLFYSSENYSYLAQEDYQQPKVLYFVSHEEKPQVIATTNKGSKLPRPSSAFLKAYCEQGGIKEVLIECEEYEDWNDGASLASIVLNGNELYRRPKIAPDNTITTRKVKDCWDRQEVIDLLLSMGNSFGSEIISRTEGTRLVIDKSSFDKWIAQNV